MPTLASVDYTIIADGAYTFDIVRPGRYIIAVTGSVGNGPTTFAVALDGVAVKAAGGLFCNEYVLVPGVLTITAAATGATPPAGAVKIVQID